MHHEVTLSDVEKYLNVSRNTATRKLNQLINAGRIKRAGKGLAVRKIR
jgi:predicted transcriptional regulator